jgi:uncharacterized protein
LAIESAFAEGWLRLVPLDTSVSEDLMDLDIGEAEALSLSVQTSASLVLLDDSAARARAAQLGIPFTGVLGILRQARRTERISSLKEAIEQLRSKAHFFVSGPLEKALLISVGEL